MSLIENEEEEEDEEGVDLSGLFGDDEDIDKGITSGADPTDWNPIEIVKRRE